ncbi:hypothetical protein [Streptomyces sp. RerS4]|uniref:hypothetical protein n=1 Tax=Streptomyces sp. RerS4 TaxID=2942449 RepID=UPI00201C6BE6|nr:hypothetical protein [Streptomyces sp. RerS4]UQX03363.1 hypothetical protein M4D82_24930 [Streptomyces sp. RerS4]
MDGTQGGGADRWAATGALGANAAYRNQTMRYEHVELNFDESVPFRTVFQLWFRAFVASFLIFLIFGLLPMLVSDPGPFDSPEDELGVGWILSVIVFWVVLLASRINEPISEWKTLLEDKHAASSSAYAAIYGALARRKTPVSAVPVRIRSDIMPEVVNNRLVVRSGRYVAYVTVFGYGTSLYVGWTMWRSRSGAVIIGHFFKDLVGGMFNRTGDINQMLRTERPRAMREAVHSAAREGVEAAVQGIEVPLASTFGQEPPIQSGASATEPGTGVGPGSGPVPPAPPVPPTAPTATTANPYPAGPPSTGTFPPAYAPYAPGTPPTPPAPDTPPHGTTWGGN